MTIFLLVLNLIFTFTPGNDFWYLSALGVILMMHKLYLESNEVNKDE